MKVKYRPHLTKVCGLARTAHNLADGLEPTQGVKRKGAAAIGNKMPTLQEAQEIYDRMKEREAR